MTVDYSLAVANLVGQFAGAVLAGVAMLGIVLAPYVAVSLFQRFSK